VCYGVWVGCGSLGGGLTGDGRAGRVGVWPRPNRIASGTADGGNRGCCAGPAGHQLEAVFRSDGEDPVSGEAASSRKRRNAGIGRHRGWAPSVIISWLPWPRRGAWPSKEAAILSSGLTPTPSMGDRQVLRGVFRRFRTHGEVTTQSDRDRGLTAFWMRGVWSGVAGHGNEPPLARDEESFRRREPNSLLITATQQKLGLSDAPKLPLF